MGMYKYKLTFQILVFQKVIKINTNVYNNICISYKYKSFIWISYIYTV